MPEEIKPEIIAKTQKSLGKFIRKPQLTEKLLKKPPFRFLHDIVHAIVKETGFLKGLFTNDELNSENVKERDAKIAFLNKLIDAVKTITKQDLGVRSSKIVAGLEPAETNVLLQAIATAIDKKIDSTPYVTQLNTGQLVREKPSKKSTDKDKKSTNKPHEKTKEKIVKVKDSKEKQKTPNETPKSTDRTKPKRSTSKQKPDDNHKPKPKQDVSPKNEPKPEPNHDTTITKQSEPNSPCNNDQKAENEKVEPEKRSEERLPSPEPEPRRRLPSASRPRSARPRSGDLRERAEPKGEGPRPTTGLRPPSVRPPSARPGAPRLRPDSALPVQELVPMGKINVIVENFDRDDEEETVVIQNAPEEQTTSLEEVTGGNKGALVEQILDQINEGDGDKIRSKKVEVEFDSISKSAASKETSNLRSMIQNLTKTANPLGKLLNYLHEDIDAMQSELEQWGNTRRQLLSEIAKQKQVSLELNKPLVAQLEGLSLEINKYEDEIVTTRGNILRNDAKIKELLSK